MLYKLKQANCCNDCCNDQRDSSTMYKVIFCDETEKELILRKSKEEKAESKDEHKVQEYLETARTARQTDNIIITLAQS